MSGGVKENDRNWVKENDRNCYFVHLLIFSYAGSVLFYWELRSNVGHATLNAIVTAI